MKNTVRIILFAIGLSIALHFVQQISDEWLIGSFSVLFTLSIVFIGFVIFFENRHPTQTLTWLVVLGSFPLVGFLFYLFFGQNIRKKRFFKKKAIIDEKTFAQFDKSNYSNAEKIKLMHNHQKLTFKLATTLGNSPISFHTYTKVLTNGIETFDAIFKELEKAKHHIHLEYYIVRHDVVGQKLKDLLIRKAKEGVQVRFLYDAVGSWRLSAKYIQELRNAGVEMVPFLPVKFPVLSDKINFRNHRKIIVVDSSVGFVGGLNIGDEYLGRNPYFGFWRDTHLLLKGEAVRSLQLIFLQDWYYMTGHKLLTEDYLTTSIMPEQEGGVQLIAGGPDNKWEIIKNLFFSMINSSVDSIWIASPYFIPDEDIKTALKIAALSGIDVRLLVPKKPDKKIVYYASRSYFPELLEAGVKIYEYEKGFMHSKIIIVDNELASIGTANMDMRSFHLNFEVNAFLYRTYSVQTLSDEFLRDIQSSHEIILSEFEKRPFFVKFIESTSRLLSPLL
ncbi:cardiolipin synthase [Bacillus kexueae]|uniref:cardiolipin synthase n=1 Tax=Aeribacillus kexueae TaxID=2078952 RepID=UPI001FAFC60A|nr:cardiolipin synthase [Bacillus kexueae]